MKEGICQNYGCEGDWNGRYTIEDSAHNRDNERKIKVLLVGAGRPNIAALAMALASRGLPDVELVHCAEPKWASTAAPAAFDLRQVAEAFRLQAPRPTPELYELDERRDNLQPYPRPPDAFLRKQRRRHGKT